jgi:aryl-alcohol dehydrogenase-like predicted oxidoreductase
MSMRSHRRRRSGPRARDRTGSLRTAVAAGVDHIDAAQYYGFGIVNDLVRDALYPDPNELAIVSKVAVRQDDSGVDLPFDSSGYSPTGLAFIAHLRENLAAEAATLDGQALRQLDGVGAGLRQHVTRSRPTRSRSQVSQPRRDATSDAVPPLIPARR